MDPVFGALGFSFIKLMYAIYFSPPLSFPLVTALNFTQIKSQSDNYRSLKNGFFFFFLNSLQFISLHSNFLTSPRLSALFRHASERQ